MPPSESGDYTADSLYYIQDYKESQPSTLLLPGALFQHLDCVLSTAPNSIIHLVFNDSKAWP